MATYATICHIELEIGGTRAHILGHATLGLGPLMSSVQTVWYDHKKPNSFRLINKQM